MPSEQAPRANARNRHRRCSSHALSLIPAACAALLAVSSPQPAAAQDAGVWPSFSSTNPRHSANVRRQGPAPAVDPADALSKRKRGQGAAEAKEEPVAGPLFAVLSLSDQHISIYNAGGLVVRSKVSTGMQGHPTPTGVFSIIGRERYHRSNIYSGAPMPFMQRVTWSGIAIHLGVVPGYPASHGCIRLPAAFAEQLWGMTKIGERIVISPREIAPLAFAHPMLPVPKLQPAPAPIAEITPAKVTVVATTANDPPPIVPPKMLNPIEYALALKAAAAADAATAARAMKELTERANATAGEARKAVALLRAAEAVRAQAEAKLAAIAKAIEGQKTAPGRGVAEAAKAGAETQLAEATRLFDEAKATEALKTREAFDAESALKEARTVIVNAQATAKEAVRRASPVSVLVSRKDNRVYVRQGLAPVLTAPVTIRDPEVPLGTHVYIATAANDGPSLAWSVVSLLPSPAEPLPVRRGKERDKKPAQPAPLLSPSNATQALERIELPKDVSQRISELLWTGGSLIISDQPLSNETGAVGTDLVVTTRH